MLRKTLYVLIPLLIVIAVLVYIYRTQPQLIPFGNNQGVSDTTAVEDSVDIELSGQPGAVVDSLEDFSPADTTDTIRMMDDQIEANAWDEDSDEENDYSGSTQNTSWHIVVASVSTEELARKMLDLPAYSGMDYRYVPEVGSYRIIAYSTSDLGSAQSEIDQLQARFPEAWISKFWFPI